MEIRIVAFRDGKGNSDEYRKFDSIEKAVEFFRKMLELGANTISTRRVEWVSIHLRKRNVNPRGILHTRERSQAYSARHK